MVKAIIHSNEDVIHKDTDKLVTKQKVKKLKKHKQKDRKDHSRDSDKEQDRKSTRSGWSERSGGSVYSAGPDDDSDTASEKELELMRSVKRRESIQSTQSRKHMISTESVVDSSSEPISPVAAFDPVPFSRDLTGNRGNNILNR